MSRRLLFTRLTQSLAAMLLAASICGSPGTALAGQSGAAGAAAPRAPQIWFSPKNPATVQRGGNKDYMQLFGPNARWQKAASFVDVFEIHPPLMRRGSDAQLKRIFRWLDRHQIALAVSEGLLHPRPDCQRMEGFDTDQAQMARRIKRLGGKLAYVVADEPLSGGRYSRRPGACRIPVLELARDVAGSAHEFQRLFPAVQIVEDESVAVFRYPGRFAELGRFLSAFREAFGKPMAAFRFDVAWWAPQWKRWVTSTASHLRGWNTPIGVLYNGDFNPRRGLYSDAKWLAAARRHYEQYEALLGVPDQVVFQSWRPNPTHLLPETSPTAFTHLILDYFATHPQITPKR